jgi:hypothetical protein
MKPPREIASLLALLAVPAFTGSGRAADAPQSSCTACHFDAQIFEGAAQELRHEFDEDVHAKAGLSCHDCHGGNPDPAADADAAMDAAWAANPFRGAPERDATPAFCGHCHSDPEYMKRFDPAARIDQEREYWTSHHGAALAQGNTEVATCVSCHGAHGILRAGDPHSPVYPPRVATTCAGCHADPAHMAGAELADGSPLPTDQYARWGQSVHAEALLARGDLSAPTCNDCHGNHGAVPPGVDSVSRVCGQCHGREATLFRASAKLEGFHRHNEYIAETGGRCDACHEAPDPPATLGGVHHFAECATCHGNHSVMRPTLAMLAPLPPYPCAFCHEDVAGAQGAVFEPEDLRRRYEATRNELLARAEGRTGSELFDWMVDQMLALPVHHVAGGGEAEGVTPLSPAFERLVRRFRIGRTTVAIRDPETGAERQEPVVRCSQCHAAQPALGSGQGFVVGSEVVERMREITSLTARAERIMLRARAGGVPVQAGLASLDQAVDSQIQLEALVHGFRTDAASDFAKTHAEGLEQARAAIENARDGLQELTARRFGLAVALVLIALVLVGLGAKIRRLGS